MEIFNWAQQLINIILHLDQHLAMITAQYGTLTYAILFVIVFCETGLVVTPFLPGDSLLFAAGAIAAVSNGVITPQLIGITLFTAALCGDNVNYWLGYFIGPKIFHGEKSSVLLNRKHLERTHAFYEKHGGKTIIIARFVPIIRTFAPFVAGIGRMTYLHFLSFSVVGALLWVVLLVGGGFYFGNIPIVKSNFSFVILAIIVISVMPMVVTFLKQKCSTDSTTPPTPKLSLN